MGTDPVDMARWLATIRTEGDRLGAMPPDALDAPVPTLGGWTLERVVRHVGKVHRWVTGLLAAPPDADPSVVARAAPSLAKGPMCLVEYRDALDEMLTALETADPDRPVASFIGRTGVAFWCRRQAHEVTIHRLDAADALQGFGGGAPAPLDPMAALDGIDEWLHVFVATRQLDLSTQTGRALANRSFGFTAATIARDATVSEGQRTWRLDYDDRGAASIRDATSLRGNAASPPDATLRGLSASVLLVAWRRRPLEVITVDGDRDLVDALLEVSRF